MQHGLGLVNAVRDWFAPAAFGGTFGMLLSAALIGFTARTLIAPKRVGGEELKDGRSAKHLAQTCVVYVVTYVAVVVGTITFADALTPLNGRLLLPIVPLAVLLFASCFTIARERLGTGTPYWYWALFSATCILVVASNVARSARAVGDIRRNGTGFQTAAWRDDELASAVRILPSDALLYSDDPAFVFFLTGRPTHQFPATRDIFTLRANEAYEEELKTVVDEGSRRGAFAALVQEGWEDSPYEAAENLLARGGFVVLLRTEKGAYLLRMSTGSKAPGS
jgi:hypothetical protein